MAPILAALLLLTTSPAARAGERPEVQDVARARMPSPEDFQLGPGDRVAVRVWRQDDLTMDLTIAPDGTISFPLVGRLEVAGLNHAQLTERLTAAISTYYADPQVTVNILEVQNQKVFVVGEVTNPAVLELTHPMTVMEAITLAGGINSYARTRNVLLVRGGGEEPQLYTVDVHAILAEGRMDQNVVLQRGDVLFVPTRTITNAARFFRDVQTVIAPFLAGSAIYRNALGSGAQGTSSVLE